MYCTVVGVVECRVAVRDKHPQDGMGRTHQDKEQSPVRAASKCMHEILFLLRISSFFYGCRTIPSISFYKYFYTLI